METFKKLLNKRVKFTPMYFNCTLLNHLHIKIVMRLLNIQKLRTKKHAVDEYRLVRQFQRPNGAQTHKSDACENNTNIINIMHLSIMKPMAYTFTLYRLSQRRIKKYQIYNIFEYSRNVLKGNYICHGFLDAGQSFIYFLLLSLHRHYLKTDALLNAEDPCQELILYLCALGLLKSTVFRTQC